MGEDPDYSKRDLYETIDKGGNVKWTMMVQVSSQEALHARNEEAHIALPHLQTMTPEEATQVDFDPFDVSE